MADPAHDLLADRVRGVLEVPLHRFLGLELLDRESPARGLTFEVGDAAENNAGVLHGGVLTSVLDVACYLAVLPHLAEDEAAVTHDATASLIRSVPRGARVGVTGTVVRRGRSLAFLRAEATVDDAVVATGQVTKSVLRTGR